MINIYLIRDNKNLQYVGSTKSKLEKRFSKHKCKSGNTCSSKLLNLHKSNIYLLEVTNEKTRKEREQYWINELDCVNENKLNYDKNSKYHKKRKLTLQTKLRHYQKSWGGDKRFNNNLLEIDLEKLFY
jgi:predicted GIY-YIG superfamily endonuclease